MIEKKTALAEGMLHLLEAEPTLLPEVPDAGVTARQMDHRRLDEIHSCLRCAARANRALVADTSEGPRWLDLCAECYEWLRGSLANESHLCHPVTH